MKRFSSGVWVVGAEIYLFYVSNELLCPQVQLNGETSSVSVSSSFDLKAMATFRDHTSREDHTFCDQKAQGCFSPPGSPVKFTLSAPATPLARKRNPLRGELTNSRKVPRSQRKITLSSSFLVEFHSPSNEGGYR